MSDVKVSQLKRGDKVRVTLEGHVLLGPYPGGEMMVQVGRKKYYDWVTLVDSKNVTWELVEP